MTRSDFDGWLTRYFGAWLTNDESEVAALFAEEAVYEYGPFREPARGRGEIVRNWAADPEGQREVRLSHEVLAVEGRTGVAHWRASYAARAGGSGRVEMDGVLVIEFDVDGRCIRHREWYARRDLPGN